MTKTADKPLIIIEPEDIAKALCVRKPGYGYQEAYQDALHVMHFFGPGHDRIVDNHLTPADRDLFYMFEDEDVKFLSTDREETTLYDGREWRIHYWLLNKDTILHFAKQYDKKFPEGADKQPLDLRALYDPDSLEHMSFKQSDVSKNLRSYFEARSKEAKNAFEDYFSKEQKSVDDVETQRKKHKAMHKKQILYDAEELRRRHLVSYTKAINDVAKRFGWRAQGFSGFVSELKTEHRVPEKVIYNTIQNNNHIIPHFIVAKKLGGDLTWYAGEIDPEHKSAGKFKSKLNKEVRSKAIFSICDYFNIDTSYVWESIQHYKKGFEDSDSIFNKFIDASGIEFILSDREITRLTKTKYVIDTYSNFLDLNFDQLNLDEKVVSRHKETLETILDEGLFVGWDNIENKPFIYNRTLDALTQEISLDNVVSLLPKIFTEEFINKLICRSLLRIAEGEYFSYGNFSVLENQLKNNIYKCCIVGKDEKHRNISLYEFMIGKQGYFSLSDIKLSGALERFPDAILDLQERLISAEQTLQSSNENLDIFSEQIAEFIANKGTLFAHIDPNLDETKDILEKENSKTIKDINEARAENNKLYDSLNAARIELFNIETELFGDATPVNLPTKPMGVLESDKIQIIKADPEEQKAISDFADLRKRCEITTWPLSFHVEQTLTDLIEDIDSQVFNKKTKNMEKEIKTQLTDTKEFYYNLHKLQSKVKQRQDELIKKYASEEPTLKKLINANSTRARINHLAKANKNLKTRLENELNTRISREAVLKEIEELLADARAVLAEKRASESDE